MGDRQKRAPPARAAAGLMRHADIRLTTAIYQHLELVDTPGTVNRLPAVGSEAAARKTGADGLSPKCHSQMRRKQFRVRAFTDR